MPSQKRIDWARGQQLAALRAIDSATLPAVVACSDGSNVSAAAILAVLKVIDDHAGKAGLCWAKAATIAAESKLGLRTVRRALAAALQIGLLIRAPARDGGGHPLVAYRICWPNLLREDPPPREAAEEPPPGGEPSAMMATPSAMMALPSEAPPEAPKDPPPPPSPKPTTREEEVLIRLGVKYPDAALRDGRQHHAAATIVALIEFYDRHHLANGWGPGALVARLRSPQPEIADGWPAADPVAAARQRDRERAAREAQAAAERQSARLAEQAERQREAEQVANLEREHGAELDALTPDELLPLVDQLDGFSRELYFHNPASQAVRRKLLQLLRTVPTGVDER